MAYVVGPCRHRKWNLDYLIKNPHTTKHIELETYTWEVLPSQFKELSVVEQMEQEYLWVLNTLNLEGEPIHSL